MVALYNYRCEECGREYYSLDAAIQCAIVSDGDIYNCAHPLNPSNQAVKKQMEKWKKNNRI